MRLLPVFNVSAIVLSFTPVVLGAYVWELSSFIEAPSSTVIDQSSVTSMLISATFMVSPHTTTTAMSSSVTIVSPSTTVTVSSPSNGTTVVFPPVNGTSSTAASPSSSLVFGTTTASLGGHTTLAMTSSLAGSCSSISTSHAYPTTIAVVSTITNDGTTTLPSVAVPTINSTAIHISSISDGATVSVSSITTEGPQSTTGIATVTSLFVEHCPTISESPVTVSSTVWDVTTSTNVSTTTIIGSTVPVVSSTAITVSCDNDGATVPASCATESLQSTTAIPIFNSTSTVEGTTTAVAALLGVVNGGMKVSSVKWLLSGVIVLAGTMAL